MEIIQNINPARLAWCCQAYRLSGDTLGQILKISPGTIQKVLNGEGGFTLNQLKKVAGFFNRGLLFFLDPNDVNEQLLFSPQFRTLTNQKIALSPKIRALVERVEEKRKTYIGLLEDLGEEVPKRWEAPRLTLDQIKQGAQQVRSWLNLTDRGGFDLIRERLWEKGVMVFLTNGYKGEWQIDRNDPVAGFSLNLSPFPVILVKKQRSLGRQTFTLVHELGHLLLHGDSFIDDEDDFFSHQQKEKAANEFAGQVLVPDEFLNQIDLKNFPYDNVNLYHEYLDDQHKKWGVSVEVILRRLLDEGHLNLQHYQGYRDWQKELPKKTEPKKGMRYRYTEPVKMFGKPFVGTVFSALYAQKISLSKASTYLDGVKISDLHKLEHVFV